MDNVQAIEYRLTAIEETLKELKDVMIKTALQQKDIEELKHKTEEITDDLNSIDKRIKVLELQPYKEKSSRWEFIINTAFKFLITGLIVYFFTKIGIPLK